MDQNQIPSFQIPGASNQADPSLSVDPVSPTPSASGSDETTLPAPMPMPAVSDIPNLQPQEAVAPSYSTTSVNTQATTQSIQDSHLIADDVDVIEKEWVERAKKVVALTAHDPYLETRELGRLKNIYMKKRFDKDLPAIPEEN